MDNDDDSDDDVENDDDNDDHVDNDDMDLSASWFMGTHFHGENSILPDFSSPRGVTTSVPFLEVRIRKGLRAVYCCP